MQRQISSPRPKLAMLQNTTGGGLRAQGEEERLGETKGTMIRALKGRGLGSIKINTEGGRTRDRNDASQLQR